MGMSKEISLCRPDESHWCVECCEGRGCSNLGSLPDGTRGCKGYKERTDLGGFRQLLSCQTIYCWSIYAPEEVKSIQKAIAREPAGEFKIGPILRELGLLKDRRTTPTVELLQFPAV